MANRHEVTIRESAIDSREALHDMLAQGLGFPSHYGANLNALDDCLGDVSSPALVRVVRERGEDLALAGYIDKVCVCLMRAARENPALDVQITFGDPAVSWTEVYLQPGDEELGLD